VALLPFDPDRARGPEVRSDARDHMTVSEVADLIRSTLENHLPSPLRVIGQVSNLSTRKHWYFSLKDEQAVVSCVAWVSASRTFGFVPDEGAEVVATGHVTHYGPQGRTQFYVTRLEPVGAGTLELKFRAMCDELRRLGYFDLQHKKPLPVFPRRIAVITSAGGAAVSDVISTAAERCRAVGLLVVDVRVQGDGAAGGVAAAIRRIDADSERLGVDAILVTRGGGSVEDLWAFNERVVADAVYECRLPLLAAIGHESDTTVIELVADVRAATPTQAVMRLIPSADELTGQLDHLDRRLRLLVQRHLERKRARLDAAVLRDPRSLVQRARERLAAVSGRLGRATTVHVRRRRDRAEALGRQLAALDPHRVLNRGYSYTTTESGALVASVKDVRDGDRIVTRVADGSIDSVVGRTVAQMDLFDGDR
jgi:exodeoxyribonuclease VII large subunit